MEFTKTRSFKITLVFLALYSLLGFVIIPLVAKHKIANYIEESTPFTLEIGNLFFNPFDLSINLQELSLKAQDEELVGLEFLRLNFQLIDSLISEWTVKPILVNGLYVQLERTNEGFPLVNGFVSDAAPKEVEEETQSDPVHWLLEGLHLTNSTFVWIDKTLESPLQTTLSDINFHLSPLGSLLNLDSNYELQWKMLNSSSSLKGEFDLNTLNNKSELKISSLQLNSFASYVSEYSNVALQNGLIDISATFEQDNTNQTMLLGSDIQLSALQLEQIKPTSGESTTSPLLSLSKLNIRDIKVQSQEAQNEDIDDSLLVEVDNIILDSPVIKVAIDKDKTLNLTELAKSEEVPVNTGKEPSAIDEDPLAVDEKPLAVNETPSADNKPSELQVASQDNNEGQNKKQENSNQRFQLNRLEIVEGNISYTDNSLEPAFVGDLNPINLVVEHLGMPSTEAIDVNLETTLNEYAIIQSSGSVDWLKEKKNLDVKISTKNLNLRPFSSFTRGGIGYDLSNGTFSADLNYTIKDNALSASNHLLIDQVDLKSSGKSVSLLPIPFAVALLKDNDGLIDLDVPISGSLDEPDFHLFELIKKTLISIIQNISTSPFHALGQLVGLKEDISHVSFEPGKAQLKSSQDRLVRLLAKALSARSTLNLKITSTAIRSLDEPAIQAAKQKKSTTSANSSNNTNTTPHTSAELTPIDDDELMQLASSRAQQIIDVLTKEGIPAERLTIATDLQQTQEEASPEDKVIVKFGLEIDN